MALDEKTELLEKIEFYQNVKLIKGVNEKDIIEIIDNLTLELLDIENQNQ